jgi:hypothetical protein
LPLTAALLLLLYCCFTAALLRWPSGEHLIATGKRYASEHQETKVVALVEQTASEFVLLYQQLCQY